MANIIFEKLRVHNFLSFGDAEVEFRDKGYTLVSGTNLNPKDGALSNGSGKSSIWSAISWALTGETIQGISTTVCHINFLDEGCWVELTFKLDDDIYKITRYRDFGKKGGDLKIIINGEDKSGDGLRKSEALLAEYLPDVTSSLLGSVIILGQGLPHRFTNNTPAGRKEVLEKLSKSDFMIEDIKARISKRSAELSTQKRKFEDELLQANTQKNVYQTELVRENENLSQYIVMPNFDESITNKHTQITTLLAEEVTNKEVQSTATAEHASLTDSLLTLNKKKSDAVSAIKETLNTELSTVRQQIVKLESEGSFLTAEINKLESIKDICPTCGQKLPHVHKQDTTEQRALLERKQAEQRDLMDLEQVKTSSNADIIALLNETHAKEEQEIRNNINLKQQLINTSTATLNRISRDRTTTEAEIQQLLNSKSNFELNKQKIIDKIQSIQDTIKTTEEKIVYITTESEKLAIHALAISKMDSLVKRDFRGFLLTNIIDFINIKAKEYCQYVFESDEIEFSLNGNSIDISYSGKEYENLSGGEKQKVDLIIQFSIRDMLSQQLNFSSNILVLDEITDNLDAKGSERIINLISNKLSDVESVFIITHHTELLQGLFEKEIKVEKDENGVSRIV